MALSIDPATKVITIPQADLTLVSGTLYTYNTNSFKQELAALLDDELWMPFADAFEHNTEVTIAGVTYSRFINIINGYSITFENGSYSVLLTGSNNNLWDISNSILNQNTVQVIPQNSAGLITVTSGSGVTASDVTDIKNAVWNAATADHTTAGTFGEKIGKKLLTVGKFLGFK